MYACCGLAAVAFAVLCFCSISFSVFVYFPLLVKWTM